MIIAIKDVDKVVLGYTNLDYFSFVSSFDLVDEENVGIKFSSTGNVFANVVLNRSSDLLLYDEDILNAEITPKSIVNNVIPYMKSIMEENGGIIDDDGKWNNALVICNDNHIYDISTSFDFVEKDDYVCHGYYTELAVSVLDDTRNLPPKARIIKTVDLICKLNGLNYYPLVITDTKSKKFEVVYQGEIQDEHYDSRKKG